MSYRGIASSFPFKWKLSTSSNEYKKCIIMRYPEDDEEHKFSWWFDISANKKWIEVIEEVIESRNPDKSRIRWMFLLANKFWRIIWVLKLEHKANESITNFIFGQKNEKLKRDLLLDDYINHNSRLYLELLQIDLETIFHYSMGNLFKRIAQMICRFQF